MSLGDPFRKKCRIKIPSDVSLGQNDGGLLSADPRQHEIGRSVLVRCSSPASTDRPATNEHRAMTGTPTHRVIVELKSIREKLASHEAKFMSNPLCALGVFGEGIGICDKDDLIDSSRIPEFLNVPMEQIQCVQGVTWAHRDTTHEGPYYVYLRPGMPTDEADKVLQPQLATISTLAARLYDCLRSIHRVHPGLLPETESWWAALFYLEIHYPQGVRETRRDRWVSISGLAHGVDPKRTIPHHYPHRDRIVERSLQFGRMQAPFEDIVPGVIWCRLPDDVFTSSIRAIDRLISQLEMLSITPPVIDWPTVRTRFAELHHDFMLFAEVEQGWLLHRAGETEPDVPFRFYWEGRLVKVASSFHMPPAHEWCGFPMPFADAPLLLSKHQADAEYFFHRGMPKEFRTLCEAAGNALPSSVPDLPVMFHRPIFPNGQICLPAPALDPDPAAKWVRFVCNSLLANDPSGEEVSVHFQDLPAGAPEVFPDIFGFATFRIGFFAASARAIELAGLRPIQPPDNPGDGDPKRGQGRPMVHDRVKDKQLIEEWERAKGYTSKKEFCEDKGITSEQLEAAQSRARSRKAYTPKKARKTPKK